MCEQAAEQEAKARAESALEIANKAVEATQKKASEAADVAGKAATAAAALEAKALADDAGASDVNWGKAVVTPHGSSGAGAAAGGNPADHASADLADEGMRARVQATDVSKAGLGLLEPVEGVQDSSGDLDSNRGGSGDWQATPEGRGRAATSRRALLSEARQFLESQLARHGQTLYEDAHSKHA